MDDLTKARGRPDDDPKLARDVRKVALGAFLRDRRIRKGFTTRQLAAKARVSHTTVVRTERGEQLPRNMEALLAYAAALELSPDDQTQLLEAGGYQIGAPVALPKQGDTHAWRDYDFLQLLYQDARRAFDQNEYLKSRLYAAKIVEELRDAETAEFRELYIHANLLLSNILVLQEQPEAALTPAHEARKTARILNNVPLDIEATHRYGVVCHKLKLEDSALTLYDWVWGQMDLNRARYPNSARLWLLRDVATAMINLREFDHVRTIFRENVAAFERMDSQRAAVNFHEIYGRSLATELALKDAAAQIYGLWHSMQTLSVSPLEKARVLVILFKLHALQGDRETSIHYWDQVLDFVDRYKLFGQIHCLESIGREVVIHRGEHFWLEQAHLARNMRFAAIAENRTA